MKLETQNLFLLKEREKAKNYLEELLMESSLRSELIDDLINLAEVSFGNMEINEKNIALVYSRIYSPELKNALPPHVLKETSNLKIVP